MTEELIKLFRRSVDLGIEVVHVHGLPGQVDGSEHGASAGTAVELGSASLKLSFELGFSLTQEVQIDGCRDAIVRGGS